jgi:Gp5 N-terminal OB domain
MDPTEDNKDFAGKNGFIWFVGVVEAINDPLKLGRCRVRCVGWHTDNKSLLPTDSLPWAQVMLPTNNTNPYPPRQSDMVVGFFADGENGQDPIIIGTLPGIPLSAGNPQQGFCDPRTSTELAAAPLKPDESATNYPRKLDEPTTSRLARNDSDYPSAINVAKKAKKASKVEPDSYYAAKYPYNNVYESESGHALEFDDTKDAERIHLYHRSGSYVEYGPLGDRAERIQRNKFTVVVGDDSVYVQGSVKMYVDGDYDLDVTGDIRINGKTVNINHGTMGAARIGDTADTGDQGTGGDTDNNSAGTNVIESGSGTVFIGD